MLLALFGYMDLLVIVKWLTDYSGNEGRAPGIITMMTNLAMSMGAVAPGVDPVIGSVSFQQHLSCTLLLIGVICVPLMLCVKPIYEYKKHSHL